MELKIHLESGVKYDSYRMQQALEERTTFLSAQSRRLHAGYLNGLKMNPEHPVNHAGLCREDWLLGMAYREVMHLLKSQPNLICGKSGDHIWITQIADTNGAQVFKRIIILTVEK